MALRSLHIAFLFGLFLGPLSIFAEAKQDQGEIPATIGELQEVVQDEDQRQARPIDAATQQKLDSSGLESAPAKQDLATLLRKEKEEFEKQTIEIPASWKRLSEDSHLWADVSKKQVIVRGAICKQDALLEMFACPRKTKEHEAVVSVHGKASEVHATLLAMNINPGQPMIWREEYYPVHGPILNIEVWWTDESGKLVKRRAQDMIRNTETGKAMACDFVFGGSEESYDPYEKKNDYLADEGPMINVANQPDAMIDVSIQSSEAAQGSLFEVFTENVPPVNTKVYIVLSPTDRKIEKKDGKPTLAELRKEDERRLAEIRKRRAELKKARDAAEAKEDK